MTPLSRWLLATVRYAAANAMKLDRRRRHHEGAAAASRAAGACSPNPSDVLVWQEIATELDDAVLKLSAADRTAVLLRFFEQKPISAVAQALNTTEAAAGMRVTRAVEKLRQRLNRRCPSLAAGGTVSLARVISAQALHAAPPGLFTAISAVSTGAAAGTATSFTIAKGVITMLTWTKIKGTAAVVAAAVVVTTGTVVNVTGARGGARQDESGSGIAQVLEEVPETRTPVRDSGPASSAVRERNGEEEAYRLIRALLQKPKPQPADIDAVVTRIGEVYREHLEKDGADGPPRKAEEVDEQVQRQMREWRAYINDEVRDVANSRRVVEPNEVVTVSVHDQHSGEPPERRLVFTQRLDDEGMLILEGIGKIKAAGARVGELEAKIAKAYGTAKTMKDWQEVTAELTLPRRDQLTRPLNPGIRAEAGDVSVRVDANEGAAPATQPRRGRTSAPARSGFPGAAAEQELPLNETERELVGRYAEVSRFPVAWTFSADRRYEVTTLGEVVERGQWHVSDHRELVRLVKEDPNVPDRVGTVEVRRIQSLDDSGLRVRVLRDGVEGNQLSYKRVGNAATTAPATGISR